MIQDRRSSSTQRGAESPRMEQRGTVNIQRKIGKRLSVWMHEVMPPSPQDRPPPLRC